MLIQRGPVGRHTGIAVAIISCGVTVGLCFTLEASGGAVRHVWSAFVRSYAHPVLQDIGRDGTLLLLSSPGTDENPGSEPSLRLWQPGRGRPEAVIALPGFKDLAGKPVLDLSDAFGEGPFRFAGKAGTIVGARGPWLVIIDGRTGQETARATPCEQDSGKPAVGVPADKLFVIAVNQADGEVAVGCNDSGALSINIWSSDLRKRRDSWRVSQPIQDLAWSPRGDVLAVLWYTPINPFNDSGEYDAKLANAAPIAATISLFDVSQPSAPKNLTTGRFDARIAFSPSGKSIYSVSHARCCNVGYTGNDWTKDDLREYDVKSGAIQKIFRVRGSGMRNNLCLSPNGAYIAAETTTDVKRFFLLEQTGLNVEAGFVILDTATGQQVFEEKRRAEGDVVNQVMPLFYSPDGSSLFVGFSTVAGDTRSRSEIREYSMPGR
jgi:hypothetical protein